MLSLVFKLLVGIYCEKIMLCKEYWEVNDYKYFFWRCFEVFKYDAFEDLCLGCCSVFCMNINMC